LLAQLQRDRFARVQMPFGDAHLADLPDGPLVLIAAGTGMAQMHSLIEFCRAAGFARVETVIPPPPPELVAVNGPYYRAAVHAWK